MQAMGGAGPFKAMPEPPLAPVDGGNPQMWMSYWRERQAAVPLDFGEDILKPTEVISVERLVRRRESIRWIPRTHAKSSHDFVWLNRGGVNVEMKATKARYETIRGRVFSARKSAWENHRVLKDVFLIDLGDAPLTTELRHRLVTYQALHNPGCSWGLNPPASSRDRAM
ncbi:hypothetical protein AAEX63_16060 [Luteococcus sp. H138]|uniref:hypothetical protein n=1 Tax=unclassified Luteococcus TaxID=2639923 RepID=UPI00313DD916